mmetsp:Transcript_54422/g.61578  ORF Transcript_54422/g.61578 Transcript_54422/m.61578 type:complete len:144 (-) Transcript_54422:105-536(-)
MEDVIQYAYHDRELNDETRDCNKKNPNNNMDEKNNSPRENNITIEYQPHQQHHHQLLLLLLLLYQTRHRNSCYCYCTATDHHTPVVPCQSVLLYGSSASSPFCSVFQHHTHTPSVKKGYFHEEYHKWKDTFANECLSHFSQQP